MLLLEATETPSANNKVKPELLNDSEAEKKGEHVKYQLHN